MKFSKNLIQRKSFIKTGNHLYRWRTHDAIRFLIELFERCREENIHTCLDTSGITFHENPEYLKKLDRLLASTNLIMLDIKHIDPEEHKKLTAQPNDMILKFAKYVDDKVLIYGSDMLLFQQLHKMMNIYIV